MECCNRLFRCNRTCYYTGMVSVKSASRYQSRPSIYIRGMISRSWPRQFRLRDDCAIPRDDGTSYLSYSQSSSIQIQLEKRYDPSSIGVHCAIREGSYAWTSLSFHSSPMFHFHTNFLKHKLFLCTSKLCSILNHFMAIFFSMT